MTSYRTVAVRVCVCVCVCVCVWPQPRWFVELPHRRGSARCRATRWRCLPHARWRAVHGTLCEWFFRPHPEAGAQHRKVWRWHARTDTQRGALHPPTPPHHATMAAVPSFLSTRSVAVGFRDSQYGALAGWVPQVRALLRGGGATGQNGDTPAHPHPHAHPSRHGATAAATLAAVSTQVVRPARCTVQVPAMMRRRRCCACACASPCLLCVGVVARVWPCVRVRVSTFAVGLSAWCGSCVAGDGGRVRLAVRLATATRLRCRLRRS